VNLAQPGVVAGIIYRSVEQKPKIVRGRSWGGVLVLDPETGMENIVIFSKISDLFDIYWIYIYIYQYFDIYQIFIRCMYHGVIYSEI